MHVIQGYADASSELIQRYESLSSADLFSPVVHLLPERNARVVDVGAGTGRDAAWFAAQGNHVLAVEPVAQFREAGRSRHGTAGIEWLDDTLPDLTKVLARGEVFHLVTLSGVWQHLDTEARRVAMGTLRALTAPDGKVILSVRHGPGAPSRPCFETTTEDTIHLASDNGFRLLHRENRESIQPQNRAAGVHWTWLAFTPSG